MSEKERKKFILGGAESQTDWQLQIWHTNTHKWTLIFIKKISLYALQPEGDGEYG